MANPVLSTSDSQRRVEAFERDLEFLETLLPCCEDVAAYLDMSRAYYLEPCAEVRS